MTHVTRFRAIVALFGAMTLTGCYVSPEDAPSERLVPTMIVPEDGDPVFSGGWYDRELDVGCAFMMTPDHGYRCVPGAVHIAVVYLDPSCSQPAHMRAADVPPFEYVSYRDDSASPCTVLQHGTVGPIVDSPVAYRRDESGACQPLEAGDRIVHRIDPLDFSTLVEATVVRGSGTPLAVDLLTTGDGDTQRLLRDATRDVLCSPRDGRFDLRWSELGELDRVPCFPRGAGYAWLGGGGSACEQSWGVRLRQWDCAPEPELVGRLNTEACGRDPVLELRRAGPEIAEPMFGPACTPEVDVAAYSTAPGDPAVVWMTRELRGTGRIRQVAFTHDGAEEDGWPIFYDTELGAPCLFDGERCDIQPDQLRLYEATHYVDPACSRLGIAGASCRSPWIALPGTECLEDDGNSCLARVGAPAARAFQRDESGACVPSDTLVYELERVPRSRMARMSLHVAEP